MLFPPQVWSVIEVVGPPGRCEHSACLLSSSPHPQLLVVGGRGDDGEKLKDAWILEIDVTKNVATCTEVSSVTYFNFVFLETQMQGTCLVYT